MNGKSVNWPWPGQVQRIGRNRIVKKLWALTKGIYGAF